MQVDEPDVDAEGVVPVGPTTAPCALAFDLGKATFSVLQHAGLFNTTESSQLLAHAPAYSTLAWRPLIPTSDALTLLAAVPAALVPVGRVPFAIPPARPTNEARQLLLDTVARLALEQSLTLEVMRRFRPLNAHLWGRWLEMLGLDAAGEWRAHDSIEAEGEREAVEKVLRAMVEVLPVFENVFP